MVMVDNCYGEFTEVIEPGDVDCDLFAGSLIKNAGGGIARTGGYIAGKSEFVELCAYRMTTPGLGREVGATLGQSRNLYMRLFNAPHVVGEDAKVVNSMITEGCEIEGTVENSVLSNGVKVEKGAIVKDAVIMSGAVIKANAKVIYSIIDSNTVISSGAVVGEDKSTAKGIAIVGSDLTLAENLVVEAGAMVNSDYGDGVSVNEN